MSDYYTQILVLSTFVLVFTLVSKYIKQRLYLPECFISLIFGIIMGKHCLGILKVNPYGLFSITRMILCLQTMNVALSLPMKYVSIHYKSICSLVIFVGCIKCILTFFILSFFKSLNFQQCWQLASALTPTDPILCSSIIKSKLSVPNRLKLLLLAESGINDGLGVILLSIPKNTRIEDFITNILWHKIIVSVCLGILLGVISKSFFKFCYRRSLVGMDSFLIHTFLLVLVSIGLTEILGGSEFICIFFCGIQFSSDEFISLEYDRRMQDTIDLLVTTTFFVVFGSSIDLYFSVKEITISILIICFRRPLICYLLSDWIPDLHNKKEALFVGWFGPIGVGAIYYSMMIDFIHKKGLYEYTCKIVFLSVCIHGLSVLAYKIYKRFNF